MLYWIFLIGIIGYMCYGIYNLYIEAKESPDEDALQDFWKHFSIVAIVLLLFCMFLGYKYVNRHSNGWQYHDKNGKEQIQYQGSQEQMNDLKEIDKYSEKHSDF